MITSKKNILADLQKAILPLQNHKSLSTNIPADTGLGIIIAAFPNNQFPTGAIHEFVCDDPEGKTCAAGFIAGLLGSLMKNKKACIWISSSKSLFPPALKSFGIAAEKIIFINLFKEKEILWVMEAALKCECLAAVICEINELSFTASRRLQLAVEKSRVTGFVLQTNPQKTTTTACVTRWKIDHLPSQLADEMPGVGFPRWNVHLLKVRNGRPGSWQLEWNNGKFRHVSGTGITIPLQKKKTG